MNGDETFFVDSNLLLYSVDPVDTDKQARAAEWLERRFGHPERVA